MGFNDRNRVDNWECMKNKYQWQGTPCEVIFGYVLQHESIEKPLYWYNFECYNRQQPDDSFKEDRMVSANGLHYACIPAVKVTQGQQSFLLANHCGIGFHKLINGGWPNYSHFSLNGKFEESNAPYFAFKKFNLEDYEHHESERNNWQRRTYAQEYAKLKEIRDNFKSPKH